MTREFPGNEVARVLAQLPGPELPWGAGAMLPAGLSIVIDDIVRNDRRAVVELGSGLSTVLLGRLLAQRAQRAQCGDQRAEYRMVAIEHDARWARWVGDQLRREGTGAHVIVVHAPLSPHGVDGLPWYDGAALAAGLAGAWPGGLADLLLVDGPPAHAPGQGLARYPALAFMWSRLAPGATVVLDDVERPGEQEVLRRWEEETGLAFDRRVEAGVALVLVPHDR